MGSPRVREVVNAREEFHLALLKVYHSRLEPVALLDALDDLDVPAMNFRTVCLAAVMHRVQSGSTQLLTAAVAGLPRMRDEWPVDDFDADVWYWIGFIDSASGEHWRDFYARTAVEPPPWWDGAFTALQVCGDTGWAYEMGRSAGAKPPPEELSTWIAYLDTCSPVDDVPTT